MEILHHHIYEFKKGLRNLVLHTAHASKRAEIEKKLEREGIHHLICGNGVAKINVFFGSRSCIDIVRTFGNHSLSGITDEQDFMLGVMLGYDRLRQCDRYLKRRRYGEETEQLIG